MTDETQSSSSASGADSGVTSAASQAGGASQQTQSSQAGTTTQTTSQAQAPARPSYVPEAFWADGKVKEAEFTEHFNQLAAFRAAEESKRLTLPASADKYELKLPATFQPPEGVKAEINTADPLWSQAREWALKTGLSQAQFEEGIALVMGDRIGTQANIKKAYDAEVAALGPTGPARVDAVITWMKAMGGQDAAALVNVLKLAPVASTIKALESVIARTSGRVSSFTATGREPPQQQNRVSEEQYGKMSPRERLDYARQFDQSQFNEAS